MGYDRPRLQVAIPAEARPGENTKPGLVTAGGASMLGAGFPPRASNSRDRTVDEQEQGGDEGAAQPGGEDVRTQLAFSCSQCSVVDSPLCSLLAATRSATLGVRLGPPSFAFLPERDVLERWCLCLAYLGGRYRRQSRRRGRTRLGAASSAAAAAFGRASDLTSAGSARWHGFRFRTRLWRGCGRVGRERWP